MFVGLNSGGVIAIFPECALLAFALVVFLRSATRDELHAFGDNVRTYVFDQEVDVVRRDDIVKDTKSKPFLASKI
jgi:hypothetical protein